MNEIEVTMDCEKCKKYQYQKGRADATKEMDLTIAYAKGRADERKTKK